MKKIFAKILCSALALCILCAGLVGCSGGSAWQAGSLRDGGAVESQGGFVAKTEKYLYYINGQAATTEDNTFGAPIKGSLMAVKLDTLGTDNIVTEIVVPKIFSATDYSSGFFIDDGYVYYGTPNTEKNSSNAIANNEMTFARTKLDGSGVTETFFTVSSHTIEYRIVKSNNSVYIVYYDSIDGAIISYDTTTKTALTVAKKDAQAKNEALNGYMFVEKEHTSDAVVFFTTTVYAEEYNETEAGKAGYVRATENYNRVYMYKAGDQKAEEADVVGTLVLDGDTTDELEKANFSLTLFGSGYLFYGKTVGQTKKVYGATIEQLIAQPDAITGEKGTLIKNEGYVSKSNIIESLQSVYVLENNVVYHTTMTELDSAIKKPVAKTGTISTLLKVIDAELYYYNTSTQLAKIKLKDVDGGASLADEVNEIRISEGTVASAWYKPQFIGDFVFFLDNSETGNSYVKHVDVNAEIFVPEEDAENKTYYIKEENVRLLGQKTDADAAKEITAKINKLSNELDGGLLVFDNADASELTVSSVTKAKEVYDNASPSVKALVDGEAVKTLNLYVEAIDLANKYAQLKGIEAYNTTDHTAEDIPASIKTAYEQIKAQVEQIVSSADGAKINGFISNNLKYYYQQAKAFFETK